MTETDPRPELARLYVSRGFRLREACAIMGIDPGVALEMLLDPETGEHISRFVTTGEVAVTLMSARKVLEELHSRATMTTVQAMAEFGAAGGDVARFNYPGFCKVRNEALKEFQRLAHPSLMELWKEALRLERAGKRKGAVDEIALKRQFAAEVDAIVGAALAPKEIRNG